MKNLKKFTYDFEGRFCRVGNNDSLEQKPM
jgi:hypothetical protein